jgi:hypothetical protein
MKNAKKACLILISTEPLSANQVIINFSLQNPYMKKMRLLKWYTPFEGLLSNLFIITHIDNANQLGYQGPMVKRLKPQSEDYLSIPANEISSTTINLSLAYEFVKGNYQLKLKNNAFNFEDENFNRFPLLCEGATIEFSVK